jgi:hypothetical protein
MPAPDATDGQAARVVGWHTVSGEQSTEIGRIFFAARYLDLVTAVGAADVDNLRYAWAGFALTRATSCHPHQGRCSESDERNATR